MTTFHYDYNGHNEILEAKKDNKVISRVLLMPCKNNDYASEMTKTGESIFDNFIHNEENKELLVITKENALQIIKEANDLRLESFKQI